MDNSEKILICGLPNSGKTTFLAALWYLVTSREIETSLKFSSLPEDREHLNKLSRLWEQCLQVGRTLSGDDNIVEMNLLSSTKEITLRFPDLSGETWNSIWEDRVCTSDLVSLVSDCTAVLLFIHSDKIDKPVPIIEALAEADLLDETLGQELGVSFSPAKVPTQVKLVEILQLLAKNPFGTQSKRLGVCLSAWDLAEGDGKTPEMYLTSYLPLLDQYLGSKTDYQDFKVFGISAQGGDFESDVDVLRDIPVPSNRIKLVVGTNSSHDLTLPLKWLKDSSQ